MRSTRRSCDERAAAALLPVHLLQQRLDRRQNFLNDDLDPLRRSGAARPAGRASGRPRRRPGRTDRAKHRSFSPGPNRWGRTPQRIRRRGWERPACRRGARANGRRGPCPESPPASPSSPRASCPAACRWPPSSTISASASLRHRPVIAREPVGRRIAGDAGVDDLDVPALGAKRRFEAIGKSLAGRQAESGGQAVAQGHEAKRARRGGVRGRRQDRREGQRLDEEPQMPI